jgi:hypothetical protein
MRRRPALSSIPLASDPDSSPKPRTYLVEAAIGRSNGEPLSRRWIQRRNAPAIIAILMGGSAAYLARSWLESHAGASTVVAVGTIVVAAQPLSFGAALSAENVMEIP